MPRVLMIGSAEYIHVRRWARGIADRGAQVVLYSDLPLEHPGVVWEPERIPPLRPWRLKRWTARKRDDLRRVLRRTRPDVVHAHFIDANSVFPEDLDDVRLVVSVWGKDIVQDDESESIATKENKAHILRSADRVVALSDMLLRETVAYANLPEERIRRQYWGVDLEQFSRTTPLVEAPTIGFFKHLEPKYGPDFLLRAFAKLKLTIPEAVLILVGDGSMASELRRLASELDIEASVEWHGKLPHSSLSPLYERCAITAMPSTLESETLGVSAIESQAMGVPVVASRIGGIPESVRHEETGLLVEPRNVDTLCEAMHKLLSDSARRAQMAKAGRRFVEEQFDWDETLDHMIATYRGQ